jgi:hypothetical protein
MKERIYCKKPRPRREYNIKMDFKVMGWDVVDWIHMSGYGNIPDSFEIGNKFLGAIKC